MLIRLIAAVLILVPSAAHAQTLPQFTDAFAIVATDVSDAAAAMPSDKYGYRPTAEVRSFAQIVAHVAGAHFLYCSQASGTRIPGDVLKQLGASRPFSDVTTESKARAFDKAELVALLNQSIAFCGSAVGAMGEPSLGNTTGSAKVPALRVLINNVAHTSEHYGNLVVYLRQNGIVPPSTARAGR